MPRTIRGTYEDGKITLPRLPKGVDRATVLVTFLPRRAKVADAVQAPRTDAASTAVPEALPPGPPPAAGAHASAQPPGRRMYFGMFAGPVVTNEEDFKLAEWTGDSEDLRG